MHDGAAAGSALSCTCPPGLATCSRWTTLYSERNFRHHARCQRCLAEQQASMSRAGRAGQTGQAGQARSRWITAAIAATLPKGLGSVFFKDMDFAYWRMLKNGLPVLGLGP